MKVSEIMSHDVRVITPDMNLAEAAKLMRDSDIGFLPVAEDEKVSGVVTDRDIVLRGVAGGLDPIATAVREVMTNEVIFAFADQDIADAAYVMEERSIRRLVVLDQDRKLAGVVSLGDISRECHDRTLSAEILESVSATSSGRSASSATEPTRH